MKTLCTIVKVLLFFLAVNLNFASGYGTITLEKNDALLSFCIQRLAFRKMMFVGTNEEHGYEADWWNPFFSLRYGIIDRLSLNIDFIFYPCKNNLYSWREYTNYTVGVGTKVHIIKSDRLNLCGALNIRHYIYIDRSWEHHNKYYQERFASIILGYQWDFKKLVIDLHAGPCYLYYRSEDYYDGGSAWTTFLETGYPFGIFDGFEATIFKHLNLEGNIFITKGIGALLVIGYKF